ncbi:uncharacterized protein LOC115320448 [Ixodes scapularis]|uniref:uncharacterized protein LOC115320448 n=1 Tax=Ixodes scapularis TaxID=6945 RepID=UPI001A9E8754|nr:uncharacterized protein LOC115320448 [Ixodes scapularis]
MTKRMKRSLVIAEELSLRPAAAEAPPPNVVPSVQVDIGSNVLVDQYQLRQLELTESAPGPFSRGLLCIVFTKEERAGKSLFGKKSNSHKNNPVKPGLDPVRVQAVIAYTCTKFGDVEKMVKGSLSSLLSKKPPPVHKQQ